MFQDEHTNLKVYAVSSQEDGVALKPGLQVDSRQTKVIGASIPIGFEYTKAYNALEPDELKNSIAKEVHCSCIETLDGKFAIPVGVHYLPSSVSANQQLKQSLQSIECMETCLACIRNSKMSFEGAVLKGNGQCWFK